MGAEIIQIKNLEKTFNTKDGPVIALKDINLSIEKGEIFGIIGLSGAGKSTLVRCMNFLEVPTRGSVVVNGQPLENMSDIELRRARQSMGMIFQQFNLLMQRTALDNICFPLEIQGMGKKEARKRAAELMELVGLSDKKNAFPAQLSGGQKQRVAIARALATNPDVLLCDEATSALDPTTTRSILGLIKEINQKLGITVIIITHEMGVIEEICHKVAIIDQSKIAECGEVRDIFSRPKSAIARKLVLSEGYGQSVEFEARHAYRITFDGRSSFEPVISNLVLQCKAPVNILYADTRNLDGKAVGQMVLQFPEEEALRDKMLHYLEINEIPYEEVKDYA
ncbi:MAG: methionine ABC transporter ATP-binding protein [Lachnospiraceae bacterium]